VDGGHGLRDTPIVVARNKSLAERAKASEQARVLRVLAERIEDEATPLPPGVFAPLRERVADNDELPPDEWEQAWATELEKRLAAVQAGKVKRIPGAKVIEEALALARRPSR
jgi:hypothetical protein